MKIHRLESEQWLPISLQEAWDFFSVPGNLDRITPADMSFEIRSGANEPTFAGQIITYRIRPFLGIPMNWVTEITQAVAGSYFIDEQRFGPYRFWHHMHRFTESNGGVLMEDTLHYVLPGGFLGELFGAPIHKKVKGIFSHREEILEEIFPSPTKS
ncbi:SRPBCC family protein [Flavobacteriales bacterium]|jgi:ligand-binding SRPBCC domain-containing protein|nr:SRPBCC family protein [Crocinitomicaceae bacterium]MDA7743264.1 SRPBCC family protein [Flavobacteriales bacterium]